MRDFVPPRPIHVPHIQRPRFIQPVIRPVTGYMPPETYSFQYPYRPPQPVRFYERYERPLFTNIHPYSYLNQSYVYPRTNRRFEEFNENPKNHINTKLRASRLKKNLKIKVSIQMFYQ